MDVKHLRTFVALAEELHFGRTAHRLHTVQPVVSKRLKEMEDELGVRLIDRSARTVELTRAGRAFLRSARQSLDHLDAGVRAAQTGVGDGVERLRLGLMIGAALPAVGRMVARFLARNPAADVELSQVTERDLGEQLSLGRIDAAVAWDASVPAGLRTATVARVPLLVLLPEDHPLAAREALTAAELAGAGVIMPGRFEQPVIWERYRDAMSRHGHEPRILMRVATTLDMLAMVAGGVGIGLSPLPEDLGYPGIIVREQDPPFALDYVLAWSVTAPVVRTLLGCLDPAPAVGAEARLTGAR